MYVLPSSIFDILNGLTKIIDIFAIVIIAISIFQTLFIVFKSRFLYFTLTKDIRYKGPSEESKKNKVEIKNLIKGLLLALEFESANAIIKGGIFIAKSTASESFTNNFDDFVFFAGILSLRIAINQTLRRFGIR